MTESSGWNDPWAIRRCVAFAIGFVLNAAPLP